MGTGTKGIASRGRIWIGERKIEVDSWHIERRRANVIQKSWGTSRVLFANNDIEVVEIRVKKGGYSSRHHHESKTNTFYVLSGELRIEETPPWTGVASPNGTWILSQDNPLHVVFAGRRHRFRALTDVVALEVYFASPSEAINTNDIVRHDVGGVA